MKTTTNIIYPVLVSLALAWFTLAPQARSACQDACLTNQNTVQGDDALISLTTGYYNTAIGYNALFSNTTAFGNTALGYLALYDNATGALNTAIGIEALLNNTEGYFNTATGTAALASNTTGGANAATGSYALTSNTTGSGNTASGFEALFSNNADFNTATGFDALFSNTTGIDNTAAGSSALFSNTTGSSNTAIGRDSLLSNSTGSSNVALGFQAGQNLTTGDNNIDIGNQGVAGDSNTIRIGTQGTQTATFIAGIRKAPLAEGVRVGVSSSGQLGVKASSVRFKEAIKPMDKASEAILALKPVTFRYKQELDPASIPQFGLVAEEVEKVNPDLVARDEQGKPYTVRYEEVNVMLLNEFLKERRKGQEQDAMIAQLKSAMAQQQQEIRALKAGLQEQAAQIQKVNDKVEMNQPAPQMVVNDR